MAPKTLIAIPATRLALGSATREVAVSLRLASIGWLMMTSGGLNNALNIGNFASLSQ